VGESVVGIEGSYSFYLTDWRAEKQELSALKNIREDCFAALP
jgi:hypothetical protein